MYKCLWKNFLEGVNSGPPGKPIPSAAEHKPGAQPARESCNPFQWNRITSFPIPQDRFNGHSFVGSLEPSGDRLQNPNDEVPFPTTPPGTPLRYFLHRPETPPSWVELEPPPPSPEAPRRPVAVVRPRVRAQEVRAPTPPPEVRVPTAPPEARAPTPPPGPERRQRRRRHRRQAAIILNINF
ncbi:uncharacterized protein LOC127276961 [Leptopilina boulardi]|uniref:uncharacterized protein LOC127276961 n=1 Tax=Leptopilina boulardi TaxID=63433 RepID=UPI0021F6828B|nr:uncharacterized protein LOC127276961 [Leptopilina boulardi]